MVEEFSIFHPKHTRSSFSKRQSTYLHNGKSSCKILPKYLRQNLKTTICPPSHRSKQRLLTLMPLDQARTRSVKRLFTRQFTKIDWNRWRCRNITAVKQSYYQKTLNDLHNRVSLKKQKIIQRKGNTQTSKIKHKIYRLNTLKENLETAKKNNQLIIKIEKQSKQRVNNFFQNFEQRISTYNQTS